MHIGNHLYSENQRKRGKQIQQWYFKTVYQPGNSHHDSLQKTLMIVKIFFSFCKTSAYSVKNLKQNKIKMCWLFHRPLGLQTATFNIQHSTFLSQGGRVESWTLLNTVTALNPVWQTGTESYYFSKSSIIIFDSISWRHGWKLRWSKPKKVCTILKKFLEKSRTNYVTKQTVATTM